MRFVLTFLSLLAVPANGLAGPIAFTVTDLGPVPSVNQSHAFSVNDSGTAVGFSTNGPVRWVDGGPPQSLGTLPGGPFEGRAFDINRTGQITGQADDPNRKAKAFIWEELNGMRSLGTLPGTDSSVGNGINDLGLIVGAATDSGGKVTAFVWDTVAMHSLSALPNGKNTQAFAINNNGWITGASDNQAVIWQGGAPIALEFLPGGTVSQGHDINAAGLVAGYIDDSAVLWNGTSVTDLGLLPGDVRGAAWGINDLGWAVGESQNLSSRAFLWDGTKMFDLNALIVGPNPLSSLGGALEISNSGYITGYGNVGPWTHAFLLTPVAEPVPEPASLVLSVTGLTALVARRRRHIAVERLTSNDLRQITAYLG